MASGWKPQAGLGLINSLRLQVAATGGRAPLRLPAHAESDLKSVQVLESVGHRRYPLLEYGKSRTLRLAMSLRGSVACAVSTAGADSAWARQGQLKKGRADLSARLARALAARTR